MKRFGKRSASGTDSSGRGVSSHRTGNNPREGGRDLGAGDGTVATGAVMTGAGRGSARMSSIRMCP